MSLNPALFLLLLLLLSPSIHCAGIIVLPCGAGKSMVWVAAVTLILAFAAAAAVIHPPIHPWCRHHCSPLRCGQVSDRGGSSIPGEEVLPVPVHQQRR
jgi:hypothetical protein